MTFKEFMKNETMTSTGSIAGYSRIAIPLVFRQWPPAVASEIEVPKKGKKKKVKEQPQVKECFLEMTGDEFAGKAQEFLQMLTSIFGKKKVKVWGEGLNGALKNGLSGVASMGTRWIDYTLNRGFNRSTNTFNPFISLNFQWDHSGKSGPTPGKMEGDTVQPGSMQFAHALKEVVRWASQNGVGIHYGAEPGRFAKYGRMLNAMGFKQAHATGAEDDYMRSSRWNPPEQNTMSQ